MQKTYTIKEICQELNCSRQNIYHFMHKPLKDYPELALHEGEDYAIQRGVLKKAYLIYPSALEKIKKRQQVHPERNLIYYKRKNDN